jgi:hypothetical protein
MDGSCPYGIRCTFVHDSDIKPPSSSITITKPNNVVPSLAKIRRDSFGSLDDEESTSSINSSGDESSLSEFYNNNTGRQAAANIFMMKQPRQQQSIETIYNMWM